MQIDISKMTYGETDALIQRSLWLSVRANAGLVQIKRELNKVYLRVM